MRFVRLAKQYYLQTTFDNFPTQNIIITSIPNGAAVDKVFNDANDGLLSAKRSVTSPKLLLETSTIEVGTSNQAAQDVKASALGNITDCFASGGIPAVGNKKASIRSHGD